MGYSLYGRIQKILAGGKNSGYKNQNDYATKFQSTFKLKAASTALLIIDMQYASASRNMGLGSLLKKETKKK